VSQGHSALQPSELAARIRYFRKKAGLRGFELATACQVTPSAVTRWETGDSEPSHENLARVARACGVDMAEFWSAPIIVIGGQESG
jgi:transcriptional regulator with XRE-family HTH domain